MVNVRIRATHFISNAIRQLGEQCHTAEQFRRLMAEVDLPHGLKDTLRARCEIWLRKKAHGLPVVCTYWSAALGGSGPITHVAVGAPIMLPPAVIVALHEEERDRNPRAVPAVRKILNTK